jgi:NADH-quinone oxidoreductase subunit N
MNQLALLTPEIFLSLVALLVLAGETFVPSWRKGWIRISMISLVATAAYLSCFFCHKALPGVDAFGIQPADVKDGWIRYPIVGGMLSVDSLSVFFKLALAIAMALVCWLSCDHYEFGDKPMGTYASLLLLATVGMMLLVGSVDLLMAIIGLELLSITSFILTGFTKSRRSSTEGAIKFFLVGTFSTGVFLYGISYYYGYFGTTSLEPLLRFPSTGTHPDAMLSLILVFLISGLGFKLAMVPFHMWAPDAYEGAPTPVTAFLSVAPKAAAIGFLLRLLPNHAALNLTPVLAALAAITMTVGNLGALQQTNVKRLLAYSSIAQVGYILVAIVAGGSLGTEAAMLYTFVYLFMNLGVFAVLMIVANKSRSEELPTFAGLFARSMPLSLAMIAFLLSLTGIPPMAGFIGKFAIFAAILKQPSLLWLGVVAVLNSVASLYYYFRIAQQMFFREPAGDSRELSFTPALVCCLLVALSVTLVAGLVPNELLSWVRNVIGS